MVQQTDREMRVGSTSQVSCGSEPICLYVQRYLPLRINSSLQQMNVLSSVRPFIKKGRTESQRIGRILEMINLYSRANSSASWRMASTSKHVLALAAVALVMAIIPHTLYAQRGASPTASLTPHTREVVEQLGKLRALDANGWKYHAGDLPHGEDVNLDDSSWTSVDRRDTMPAGAVWYRRWFEMPKTLNGYDLPEARIWFQFRVDAHGPLTEIIYFNGRRVALGEGLEPVVLFDHAKPGERILVAIKLPETVSEKSFSGASATIAYPPSRPDPTRLYQEILTLNTLAPSLGSETDAAHKAIDDAAAAVDLTALAGTDSVAFDASLRRGEAALTPLQSALQKFTVHLTGQSHIDAAWLWPWTETVDVVRRTFATSLQLMNEYPQFSFTQSASAYNEWIDEKYPAIHDGIMKRLQEGRWEIVGGMWVEPDLNIPDGESLVRQILIGKRYIQQHYGVDVRIGWNPDSFGFNWQLPQIYKKSGIDYFMTTKLNGNETHKLPLKLFWWQAPDGSRVLSYFPNGLGGDISPVGMAGEVNAAIHANPGTGEIMHIYGVGDHGGGPTRASLDSAIPWTQPGVTYPKANFGTAQAFFSDVEPKLDTAHAPVWNYDVLTAGTNTLPQASEGKVSLPVWNDELYFEYHRGTYTTQANLKREIRFNEEGLLNAEKYSSLAWLRGSSYPQDSLNEAWKKLLFNEFHDLAAGSGIGIIYKDAQRDFDMVHAASSEAQRTALHVLLSDVNTLEPAGQTGTRNTASVVIFNSLGWSRDGSVEVNLELPHTASTIHVTDSSGRELNAQILEHREGSNQFRLLIEAHDVPALGYEVLHVNGGNTAAHIAHAPDPVRVDGTTLENHYLRVVLDPKTGCIISLYDKLSHFETIASGGCGNQLQTFHDLPRAWDAWNIDADFDKVTTPIDSLDSLQTIVSGPERGVIRIARHWQNSKFVQQIVLDANSPEVQVINDIDWHETHVLLKAAFPLAATSSKATFEIPFGSIERPATRNNSWDSAFFEVPALRWGDLGDGRHGFSLINESKYGYDAKGNTLRLSLLRSPVWPDPEADRGLHHFSYWLYPHAGDWKTALTVHHGYEANYPLVAMQVEQHEGSLPGRHSFVSVTPADVILTSVKKAEDSNALLFRVYESAGKQSEVTISVPEGGTAATATNLMEHPQSEDKVSLASGHVSFTIHPYEIQTIQMNYPSAERAPTAPLP
jgi:alpha-mannosidase